MFPLKIQQSKLFVIKSWQLSQKKGYFVIFIATLMHSSKWTLKENHKT